MTIDEIVGASLGIILFVAVTIACIIILIMYVNNDIKKHRKQDNLKEVQRSDAIRCLQSISISLFNICETLNKKGIKENEED